MSERSLRNWFKAYTGLSVSKYANARRMEYAARIFRLFPASSKAEVARIIGLNASTAIYSFMRKNGVVDIDTLRRPNDGQDAADIPFRLERLPDSILFYMQDEILYDESSTIDFEKSHWDITARYVKERFPQAEIIGDMGFAVDKFVENNANTGVFISGILCRNLSARQLRRDMFGDIGWRVVPARKYAVFSYKGAYDGLDAFYRQALHTLLQNEMQIEKSALIMEKYINSPVDTPTEELMTEIWVAISA